MNKLRKMLLLIVAVMLLALTACGSEPTVETPVETTPNDATEAPVVETTVPVLEETTPEETTEAVEVAPEGKVRSYLTGLWEDERYMMITMRHHTPLVVAKAQLNGGQAEGLAQFLEKKTGLEIRHFRR